MGTATRALRLPVWVLGLVPLVFVVGGIALFMALDAPGLGERRGPPAEELAVERTVLSPGAIELTVRNDGADAVSVAQVVVNDGFAQFSGAGDPIGRLETATVKVVQPWVEGEAYEVALLTSTGGTIVHEIPVAVETPSADAGFYGLMALLGIYVGVIPVALGMLWLPWLRRVPPDWLRALMAVTVGLLAFLAIDATLEGLERAGGEHPGGDAAHALGGPVLDPRCRAHVTSKKPCQPSSVNSDWCAWNMYRPGCGNRHSRMPRWPWQSITVSVCSDGCEPVPVGK